MGFARILRSNAICERSMSVSHPFIKWVGGKGDIVNNILTHIPKRVRTYHEPFIGGGSVLIALLDACESGERAVDSFCAYDMNPCLIECYRIIQSDAYTDLLREISALVQLYNDASHVDYPKYAKPNLFESLQEAAGASKYDLYYYIRARYNVIEHGPEKAALFLFLNKTGYRGMYRVNTRGEYNIPFGNYSNIAFDTENIARLHALFRKYGVVFECADFAQFDCARLGPADCVYLDPPYSKITKESFTEYTQDGFGDECQSNVRELCDRIDARGAVFILSNAETDENLQVYGKWGVQLFACQSNLGYKTDGESGKRCKRREMIVVNREPNSG